MKKKCVSMMCILYLLLSSFSAVYIKAQEPVDQILQDPIEQKSQQLDLKLQLLDTKLELLDSKIKLWEAKPEELDIRLNELDERINSLSFEPADLNDQFFKIDSLIAELE